MNYLMIFLGGGLGSLARYYLARHNSEFTDLRFIYGTLIANVISCLILGGVIGYMDKFGLSNNAKLLLITGFCGGFSTFSTFSYEILQYMLKGNYAYGISYILISLILGIAAMVLGMKLLS